MGGIVRDSPREDGALRHGPKVSRHFVQIAAKRVEAAKALR